LRSCERVGISGTAGILNLFPGIYQRLIDSDPSNTADRESLTWYTEQTKAAKTNP
jgi:hypothetical protein